MGIDTKNKHHTSKVLLRSINLELNENEVYATHTANTISFGVPTMIAAEDIKAIYTDK